MKTIVHGNENMKLHDNGNIERTGSKPSGQWKVVGAVKINNFGYVVEHATLKDILSGKLNGQWHHKNGKQKWHVKDFDHGSFRIWMSPQHSIY